ncbi:MAG: transporter substrate-binding domain-containing protein [Paludibacteraceae bacterium]
MLSKRNKTGLGVIVVILAFVFLLVLLRNHSETLPVLKSLHKVESSGRLRVVTDGSSLGFKVIGNKLTGFNYELAKAFADSMGLELEVVLNNDFDSCVTELSEGNCDIAALCIPTTANLKTRVAFSAPIYSSRQVLVQCAYSDSVIHNIIFEQRYLSKDSICISKDSPHRFRLENLSNEIAKPIKIVELEGKTTEDLVKMVAEGKIKYTICDELQARKLQKTYSNIDIDMAVGFNQPLAWAVSSKSKELLTKLNDFLNDFLVSSDYWEIYRRYF